jgi:RimJ/RimL family protein N-acetyltransferase
VSHITPSPHRPDPDLGRPDDGVPERTWDGLPVAQDEPHGAQVVVRRPASQDTGALGQDTDGTRELEYLMLHRAARGIDYEGDWAWTPPSGARLPGEPVLTGALRELAEETGISGAELMPVDLSGPWAAFAVSAGPDIRVRLDAEHDRFAWLPADEAARRCTVADAAATFRRAAAVSLLEITFRPLAWDDLPDLVAWMHAPHAVRWFYENVDLPAAERKYGPRIDGTSPTRVHVVLIGGRACGFIQHYLVGDYPDYSRTSGEPEAAGIDYIIGVEGLTGQGLGPQMIWSYLRQVVFAARPEVSRVIASPEVANVWSVRVLEKSGFRALREILGEDPGKPEMLCVLDRQRAFG